MFDHKPKEREWLSWLSLAIWIAVIYLTIPFVRLGTGFVKSTWGSETFTYVIALVLILATLAVLVWLMRKRALSPGRFAWMLAIAGIFIALTFGLKSGTPEEAIHLLEYGVLSILAYRAFSHRIGDYSIYIAATLLGTLTGMVDEAIQWLVPGRYFGLHDIAINLTAVALVQLAIAAGIRPAIIAHRPTSASLRRICRLGAMTAGLLGLFHLNTPGNIAAYSAAIPALAFLNGPGHIMIEFGHLYDDPEIGRFRSRLAPEELAQADRTRARETALILDQYASRDTYPDFLRRHIGAKDPLLHEARVHLYSRNVNAEWARDDDDPVRRRQRYTTAYRENRIVEKYFGETLSTSASVWPDEFRSTVIANKLPGNKYDSLVSRHLITAYSPWQAVLLFGVPALLLFGLGQFFGIRRHG